MLKFCVKTGTSVKVTEVIMLKSVAEFFLGTGTGERVERDSVASDLDL